MRFAVLDAAFADRVRPWPQIVHALLNRAERRARNLNVQRAIACQPRLDVRLALLLWHLAARWGRVEPGGIRLPLPLTHQLLGRLVGAERPSVSHALARLARSGLVTGHGDEWHLHGNIRDHLGSMIEPAAGRVEQLLDAASGAGASS
jgi:CRP-like cAMP-binding protein